VDGTLVTRAKVVTAGAIEAIEKLHDRQGALRDHQRAAAVRDAHAGSPAGDARADSRPQRQDHRATGP